MSYQPKERKINVFKKFILASFIIGGISCSLTIASCATDWESAIKESDQKSPRLNVLSNDERDYKYKLANDDIQKDVRKASSNITAIQYQYSAWWQHQAWTPKCISFEDGARFIKLMADGGKMTESDLKKSGLLPQCSVEEIRTEVLNAFKEGVDSGTVARNYQRQLQSKTK